MKKDVIHDSDQKSINVHDSKQAINKLDVKQNAASMFGYGTNPLQSQSATDESKDVSG